jgi:hypothetical protein
MVGIVALALAVFVAAYAIKTYEAWWTIGLVLFGVIILAVERSSLRRGDAVRAAAGLIGSIVLAAAGFWMVVLGMFGRGRPCDECFDNGLLFLPGLGTIVVAIALAAVCLLRVARAFGAPGGGEPPELATRGKG